MVRRSIIAACVLLCLVLVLAALWAAFDWPPPRLILKYGFPPTGGPTGRTMTIEGVEFVELKPGYLLMGSHRDCPPTSFLIKICKILHLTSDRQLHEPGWECPPHWVEIGRSFWVGRTEVSNIQFESTLSRHGRQRGWSPIDLGPAIVSFADAHAFCIAFSESAGCEVRLLSEAEWEYACRVGRGTAMRLEVNDHDFGRTCWSSSNSGCSGAKRVGTLEPNAWGLYDMLGNVWEWCADNRHNDYVDAPTDGSPWLGGNTSENVIRGGCFADPPDWCVATMRNFCGSTRVSFNPIGFRVAMSGFNSR